MTAARSQIGFTLIELLVVIVIMMSVLGMVGGASINSVKRAEAQSEVIGVYGLIKKSSVMAFASGASLKLAFLEDRLHIQGHSIDTSYNFQYLMFEPQQLNLSRNGWPSKSELKVKVLDTDRILDLKPILRENKWQSDD